MVNTPISDTDNPFAEALQQWLGYTIVAVDGGEIGPTQIYMGKLIRKQGEHMGSGGKEVYAIEIPTKRYSDGFHELSEFMHGFIPLVDYYDSDIWNTDPLDLKRPADGFSYAKIEVRNFDDGSLGGAVWPSVTKASVMNWFYKS